MGTICTVKVGSFFGSIIQGLTHFEDSSCNVCQNVGKSSFLYLT